MTQVDHSRQIMDIASLTSLVQVTEPSTVLVPSWVLRRILVADCGSNGSTFLTLRGQSHGIARERLLEILNETELPVSLDSVPGPLVILLPEPDAEWLAATPAPVVLLQYWRLLFHARTYALVRQAVMNVSPSSLRERIQRIGHSAFNDARFTLIKDHYLPVSADDRDVYARFAAIFLELDRFSPLSLPYWFGAIDDQEHVRRALAGDVDADELFRQTRLEGSADPSSEALPPVPEAESLVSTDVPGATPQQERYRPWMLSRAARAASVGNVVRSAILHVRAGRLVGGSGGITPADAERLLDPLIDRLRAALGLDSAQARQWRASLGPILVRAADGWWNAERRILYDLQKVCVDHERQIHALDGLRWLLTLGRRPLRRPLPAQGLVLMCRHLQAAARRLAKARLPQHGRAQLGQLLRAAILDAETRLRKALGPVVRDSLHHGGLEPQCAVEQVAEQKLIAELLDSLIKRGFVTMSDLRDALSRNQIKLQDLHGIGQFFSGDQLLQIDRHLGTALDGVYHPGEAYLRLFQRISSVLFANRPGRWLTYHLIIPFGGAFLALEGFDHTIGSLLAKVTGSHVTINHLGPLVVLGTFLFALVNSPAFRATCLRSVKMMGHAVRWLVVDLPQRIVRWPLVQSLLASRPWRIFVRHVLKPLVPTAAVWHFLPEQMHPRAGATILAAVFVASSVLLNSRIGRLLEQVVRNALLVFWTRLTAEFLAGLFNWVVHFFRVLLETVERFLYAVDEWLRFRTGQRRFSLAIKATLGVFWAMITYCTRFFITLLTEPQINPIKHFPVVTVSHKLILPTVPLIASALHGLGLGKVEANTAATTIAFLTPGIFGFLAWELKENWRLYRANRPRTLRPVQVGGHGETLKQLLRPGFHSGTLPKLFARLRRTDSRGLSLYGDAPIRKQIASLEHVREAVSRFICREFLAVLNQHSSWTTTPLSLGEVRLASTRIRVALHCPMLGEVAWLTFEQQAGWIIAQIDTPGWIAAIDEPRSRILSWALLGLYRMSGVDIVREQVESLFSLQRVDYEFRKSELVVWPSGTIDTEISYDLTQPLMLPRGRGVNSDPALPTLDAKRLFLRHTDVEWHAWARLWEPGSNDSGGGAITPPSSDLCLLPASRERHALPVAVRP